MNFIGRPEVKLEGFVDGVDLDDLSTLGFYPKSVLNIFLKGKSAELHLFVVKLNSNSKTGGL